MIPLESLTEMSENRPWEIYNMDVLPDHVHLDISCDPENRTLTCEIRGTLEDNDYMPVEFDNSWYWMLDYDRVIEPSYPDRQGYKIKFTHETYAFEDAIGYGSRTLTHREVYKADNGELVLDEIINPRIPSGYAMDTYYSH